MTEDTNDPADDTDGTPDSTAPDAGGADGSRGHERATDDADPATTDDPGGGVVVTEGATPDEEGSRLDADRWRSLLNKAVLAGLLLFALVAAFRFYFAASNAISYWVGGGYQSAFQAAFNLVVLLLVAAALDRQVGRMSDAEE